MLRDLADWNMWLRAAQPGDEAIYHRGECLSPNPSKRHPFGHQVLAAAHAGLVIVFQERMSPPPGRFRYVARRISAAAAEAIARADQSRTGLRDHIR